MTETTTAPAAARSTAPRNADFDLALMAMREAYVTRNPRSLARHIEALAVMPGGNTRSVLHVAPFAPGLARGEGCRVWDLDGHAYIDMLGEYTAGLYGHSNPVIRAAIDRALNDGVTLGGQTLTEMRLARAVCARFPTIERVRFTNSGTEANLMAIAAAMAATGRRQVMVFAGGYHGGVLTFAEGGHRINVPHDFIVAPYNDTDAAVALIAAHAASLAAVLLEPMLGAGGCIPAEPGFLHALRAATTQAGALLILDEVMTSRLAPGGLQSVRGITPDLTTLGKYLGGGMSCGAFGGRADIMDRFDPRRDDALPHAGTFNNNVLTMAAGLAGLTEVFTPDAAIALGGRGDALRARLNALCLQHDAPMQFTGIGSMLSLHMTRGTIRAPADAAQEVGPRASDRLKELFFLDMLQHGIWLARRGMMTLSLPIGDAECDQVAGAVEEFLHTRGALLRAAIGAG